MPDGLQQYVKLENRLVLLAWLNDQLGYAHNRFEYSATFGQALSAARNDPLFGRGVRLKGRDWSLKRSAALGGQHPHHIKLLETLSLFAVRANYMAQFRD